MSTLDQTFAALRAAGRKAFLPFVTAGDPDMATTAEILKALGRCGATIAEVGVPYSDPIADGPVIQASYQRALDAGFRLPQLFEMTAGLKGQLRMPLVTMVSYSIIHRTGMRRYIDQAMAAGVCGAIVPDLLLEEAQPLAELCRAADFSLIQLVTPTTPRERQVRIAELSSGFLYFVSVTGITGERSQMAAGLLDNVAWLREQTSLPVCVGFGISTPETARSLAQVADGVIVGSALVRRIADANTPAEAVENVTRFATELISALA